MWCAWMFAFPEQHSSIFGLFSICLWWMVWLKVLHKFWWQSSRHNKNSWILLIFTLEWLLPSSFLVFAFCTCNTSAEARGFSQDEQRMCFSACVVLIRSHTPFCVFSGHSLLKIATENFAHMRTTFPSPLTQLKMSAQNACSSQWETGDLCYMQICKADRKASAVNLQC